MANANQKPFKSAATQHSFNKDRSLVCLSQNTSEVFIYKTNGAPDDASKWDQEPAHTLKDHTGYISGIDWCAETNLIVTCGHDRNAYVWKHDEAKKTWEPTLVILRINRAATAVKWSPDGKKFAVASGAKCVPVCHFEESNNWWISKMIKKHKSTVTSLAWSPNGKFLLTGACDFKARIFSAFIEGLDSTDDEAFGSYPKQHEFGEVMQEWGVTDAWVNDVAWSPNGKMCAFVGHGSTLHFCAPNESPTTIYSKSKPFLHCFFLNDDTLIGVGWDSNPHVYVNKGGEWTFDKKLDPETAPVKKVEKKAFGSAFSKFQQADTQGQKFGSKKEAEGIMTFAQNTMISVHLYGDSKTFTTASLDGRVLTWAV